MSDRREFLKSAGLLGLAPLSKAVTVAAQDPKQSGEVQHKPHAPQKHSPAAGSIVLENGEMRLEISSAGEALSLVHKATGQECLAEGIRIPMFSVTQYRPYDNELQLSYPAEVTEFPVAQLRQQGSELIAEFALVGYSASISVKITDSYIGFHLEKLTYHGYTSLRSKKMTPIDEAVLVQLPIAKRENLGEWLNVMWDENVAVNLLATDPYTRIQAKARDGYFLFQAGAVNDVQLEGVGAALIVTSTPKLLDQIARVETDYQLPEGVKSRRSREYGYSYYETSTVTPQDADRHIRYAALCGLRAMDIYYVAFAKTSGHFPWKPEYPRGMADLQDVVAKVRGAGILPGVHIHYNKTHKQDAYVTPNPDPRLNLSESLTLSQSIDASAREIPVEENPRLCTLDDERRILKIQNELVTYERYTTKRPFQFEGCQRGALGSQASAHELSSQVGLLDVDTWPIFVRFAQNTSIQDEVADRIKKIYEEAGFQFVYYDGAEDVSPPFWFNVARAQWVVGQRLDPQPIFAEGACKSHFSWHILTRGNAFDVFRPEVIKAATRAYPAAEVERAARDFTAINFGWIGYWAPDKTTMGTQPDMLEYVTSRAAAWDCPIALVGDLDAMDRHPRTPDNCEVLRRWEQIRERKWLTHEQKKALRNLEQEHTLLINERGDFVLAACMQIEKVGGEDAPGRAFLFEYEGSFWVSYWHTSGDGTLQMSLSAGSLTLFKDIGKPLTTKKASKHLNLPIGERRYVRFSSVSRTQVISCFQGAIILSA